jgi:hypothetical protein
MLYTDLYSHSSIGSNWLCYPIFLLASGLSKRFRKLIKTSQFGSCNKTAAWVVMNSNTLIWPSSLPTTANSNNWIKAKPEDPEAESSSSPMVSAK